MRPSREDLFLEIALVVSRRSTCPRKHVGAVMVRENRIVSIGYNGAPPGMPHCIGVGCGGGVQKPTTPGSPLSPTSTAYPNGCTRAIHAEMNAIAFAARQGAPTDDATMYSTCATCANCAALLVSCGISSFIYLEEYRIQDGINLLKDAGVKVVKYGT
jgi:dCMP deaminase